MNLMQHSDQGEIKNQNVNIHPLPVTAQVSSQTTALVASPTSQKSTAKPTDTAAKAPQTKNEHIKSAITQSNSNSTSLPKNETVEWKKVNKNALNSTISHKVEVNQGMEGYVKRAAAYKQTQSKPKPTEKEKEKECSLPVAIKKVTDHLEKDVTPEIKQVAYHIHNALEGND